MGLNPSARRRWLGGGLLAAALVMLWAGETMLKEKLGPIGFLVYWLICVVLTCGALVLAFRDLRGVREQTRKEHRELFEATLKDIELQARRRAANPSAPNGAQDSRGSDGS